MKRSPNISSLNAFIVFQTFSENKLLIMNHYSGEEHLEPYPSKHQLLGHSLQKSDHRRVLLVHQMGLHTKHNVLLHYH